MPFRIMIAADHHSLIQMISGILRLFSLSCVITLATTASEMVTENLQEADPHLLILGFSRSHARNVIKEARTSQPRLKVLWLGEDSEALPEADATLSRSVTPLRLVDAMTRALR